MADYPIRVIDARRFKDSEKLETDARLLFGILQREGDAEAVEAYAKENEEAFQNVCEDTFDAIAILTNHKSIMGITARLRCRARVCKQTLYPMTNCTKEVLKRNKFKNKLTT